MPWVFKIDLYPNALVSTAVIRSLLILLNLLLNEVDVYWRLANSFLKTQFMICEACRGGLFNVWCGLRVDFEPPLSQRNRALGVPFGVLGSVIPCLSLPTFPLPQNSASPSPSTHR